MASVLDQKVRQMHAALAGLRSEDLSSVEPQVGASNGLAYAKVDFNQKSDPIELANAATLVVANIASLKDHLKVWCKKQGVTFDGDALIETNGAVALIHDLWNIDKHAELDRPPRSGRTPSLRDIRTSLSVSAGTQAGGGAFFSMDPRTGQITTGASGGGSVELVIVATIVDETGTRLGDFAQVCAEAAEAWSKALRDAGVPLP